jgi:hypothetical protein
MKLEAQLQSGEVKIKVSPTGAVAFVGTSLMVDSKISDVCAFRKLQVSGSAALRAALVRAEAMAGVKANPRAQAMSGEHAHGEMWHGAH